MLLLGKACDSVWCMNYIVHPFSSLAASAPIWYFTGLTPCNVRLQLNTVRRCRKLILIGGEGGQVENEDTHKYRHNQVMVAGGGGVGGMPHCRPPPPPYQSYTYAMKLI